MSKEQDAKREALALELSRRFALTHSARPIADFILAREAEREGPLVAAMELANAMAKDGHAFAAAMYLESALIRYRALDAPPQRTLAEVAKDVVGDRVPIRPHRDDDRYAAVSDALLDELAEALKREEGKR